MTEESSLLQPGERLVLVSNRLPVSIERDAAGGVSAKMSSGGLATGLRVPHEQGGGPWIGWPGEQSEDAQVPSDVKAALEQIGCVGVGLTDEEHRSFYQIISNRCIWPLFHYFTDQVRFAWDDWETYVAINRRFAAATLAQVQAGDTVFIQDFHLTLVPQMLREARPDLRIGFFLHIPFPSSEIFRLLPAREELLRGMLGADLIGLHTLDYVRHFRSALVHVLGLEPRQDTVEVDGREVRIQAHPLGLDASEWEQRAVHPDTHDEMVRLREAIGDRRLILGVDRLDYTKGIPERLQAFGEFLARDQARAKEIMMIQVAVPSRVEVEEYRTLKDEVDRIAGQVNGEHGQPGRQPLHYMYRSVDAATLSALYQLADVALVTPLRDGLNLVAKEYVASRQGDDGVLVLGECVGAAWELGEALRVNPYDPIDIVHALERALCMSPTEQSERMSAMRRRVRRNDVGLWIKAILDGIRGAPGQPPPSPFVGDARAEWEQRWIQASQRTLFLDYDGTLREFVERYDDAQPTSEILGLLKGLAAREGLTTWIVSGRPAHVLEEWLGSTGVGLVAEHGAFVRRPGAKEFRTLVPDVSSEWRELVREAMEQFVDRVPGSLVEEKPLGLVWHYRGASPTRSQFHARELQAHLTEVLAGQPLQVLRGNCILEVRPAGIDKGNALRLLSKGGSGSELVVAIGDDLTDEDAFWSAPEESLTLLVGNRHSAARHRLDSPGEVRALLAHWASLLPRRESSRGDLSAHSTS